MKSRHALGHSLTEVLVTMLVLSAGVMGATGLQVSAWTVTQQSAYHTAAQQLAAEMAEWLLVLDKSMLDAALARQARGWDSAAGNGRHCYNQHCTDHDLLAFVIDDWQARVQAVLPDAEVRICRDGQPWQDEEAAYRWACTENEVSAPLVVKLGWRDKLALDKAVLPLVVLSVGL